MNIICLKCGHILTSVDEAKNHPQVCKDSRTGGTFIIPSTTFISSTEIRESLKNQSGNKNIILNLCPLKKDLIQEPFLRLLMLNRSCCYNVDLAQKACNDVDRSLNKSAAGRT